MGEVHPVSSAGEGVHGSAVSETRDRHRVAWLILSFAVLFLLPAEYARRHGEPTPYESQGNYALVAGAMSESGTEDIRLSTIGDEEGPASSGAPPVAEQQTGPGKSAAEAATAPDPAPVHIKHDQYYCGFLAQAMTGNVTPEQAARRARTNGAIIGAMGGAALGALFGGTGGHAGRSGAVGASAGLLAGIAMGSSSAQRAADDIRSRYDAAYSWCMNQKDDTAPKQGEARS